MMKKLTKEKKQKRKVQALTVGEVPEQQVRKKKKIKI